MCVYMMVVESSKAELTSRLDRLVEEDASCLCSISGYQDLSEDVRETPSFRASLRRAQAMADESRLVILALLRREKELCACELQAALDVTHPTVSHHMQLLERAGFVSSERRGKWIYYRLARDAGASIP